MTALPTTLDTALHVPHSSVTAYRLCVDLERCTKTDKDTVYARVLGYLMLLAPTPTILHEVTAAINLCQAQGRADWALLSDLGRAFVYFLITPFMKSEDITPPPSPGWGSDTESDTESEYDEAAVEARRDVKKQAYIRDGFRCVLSGVYNYDALKDPSINRDRSEQVYTYTHLGHIVPDSKYLLNEPARNHSAHKSILAILHNFGYSAENPNGFACRYNSLPNVMTISRSARLALDHLCIWLEPPQNSHDPNTYVLRGIGRLLGIYEPGTTVNFTTPDPVKLPTPSSQLIGLHAFISKLADLSGARDLVENWQLEMEGLGAMVRQSDPNWEENEAQGEKGPVSAELLSFALNARLTR